MDEPKLVDSIRPLTIPNGSEMTSDIQQTSVADCVTDDSAEIIT
jgi:hypothetical protein